MSKQTTRRDVLKRAAAASAAVFAPTFLPGSALSDEANERMKMGGIGCGGIANIDVGSLRNHGDYIAYCDAQTAKAVHFNKRYSGGKARIVSDYRRILEDPNIDIVSISTPDHWHVKIAIEALQAGKHVFCQKPLTFTLEEGLMIIDACRKYPRQAFLVGTQQRYAKDLFLRAVNMVQKGLLGEMKKVTCMIGGSPSGGPFPVATPPADLDWNYWLGPAPKVDYIPERCFGTFRWWYEYSGGKFTDWGAHHVDIAMWALGLQTLADGPTEIDGTEAVHPITLRAGQPTVDNCFNTATTFNVRCKMPGGVDLYVTDGPDNGILFEGSKGRIFVNRAKITGLPIEENWDEGKYTDDDLTRMFKGKSYTRPKINFMQCVREGGLTTSDPFSHVAAMQVCHLSAIAARLGRVIRWDAAKQEIIGDEDGQNLSARKPRAEFAYPEV